MAHGTYILILHLPEAQRLEIGKFGMVALSAGYYAYVGSAFGSGGLSGRLNHHRHIAQKPHWHVDYLRRAARLTAIWNQESEMRREHEWAAILGNLPGVTIPAARFGASDCRCPAHLFYFGDMPPLLEIFQEHVRRHFPNDSAISIFSPE